MEGGRGGGGGGSACVKGEGVASSACTTTSSGPLGARITDPFLLGTLPSVEGRQLAGAAGFLLQPPHPIFWRKKMNSHIIIFLINIVAHCSDLDWERGIVLHSARYFNYIPMCTQASTQRRSVPPLYFLAYFLLPFFIPSSPPSKQPRNHPIIIFCCLVKRQSFIPSRQRISPIFLSVSLHRIISKLERMSNGLIFLEE